jgi:hypothetical protein
VIVCENELHTSDCEYESYIPLREKRKEKREKRKEKREKRKEKRERKTKMKK